MQSNERDERVRRNIPVNVARSVRQWEAQNHTEAPEKVKESFRKSFEGAEYERIRRDNIKRGTK